MAKVQIIDIPTFKNGGKMKKAQSGLQVEGNKFTPMTSDSVMINGNSHENGGTKLSYNGNMVEAEAGEPLTIGKDGNATIYGNMKNPITGNKFKSDAKKILQKEQRVDKLMDYSTDLLSKADPYDKFGRLQFNGANAMMTGASIKKKELQQSKEHLGDVQQAILDMSDEMDIDANHLANGRVVARKGKKLMNYQQGGRVVKGFVNLPEDADPNNWKYNPADGSWHENAPAGDVRNNNKNLSLAQRHNNPGNLMFSKWESKYGAVEGEPRYDKSGNLIGHFAKFPDVQSGQTAMKTLLTGKSYNNLTVAQASKRWTGEGAYNNIPASIRDKKISDLNPDELNTALDTFTLGEDSKTYNWDGVGKRSPRTYEPQPPYEAGRVGMDGTPDFGTQPIKPRTTPNVPGYDLALHDIPDYKVGTNAKGLDFNQVVPELYAAATNKREPVFAQKYQPELFEPYQVSFQDRRNLNNQTFRAVSQRLTDNPGGLSQLAAQKYEADNQVNADEFRTNQQINNDITNKNVGLLNDAQNKNLQIADTQYVRASQAKSNTKAVNQAIVTSISGKIAQNQLENRQLQVYENLYPHYRYDQNYQLQKEGAPGYEYLNQDGSFGANNSGGGGMNPDYDTRTRVNYNKNNQVTGYTRINQSELDTATKQIKVQNEREKNLQYILNNSRYKIPQF